jgi:hypothetical protein
MTELGSNARSLIELARHEDDPDDAARERLQEVFRVRLSATLAAADKASGVESLGRSGLRYQAAKGLVSSKSVLALAAVVAAVGAGRLLNSKGAPAVAAGSARSAASAPAPTAATSSRSGLDASGFELGAARVAGERDSAPRQGSTSSETLEPSSASGVSEPRERTKSRREAAQAVPTRPSALDATAPAQSERDLSGLEPSAGSEAKPAAPPTEALLAEARALREAQQVLRTGNSARALMLLAEQERQFPRGQLGEARAAARAMALCSDQSMAVRLRSAAAFEARWPGSILLSSVRGACGSSKE